MNNLKRLRKEAQFTQFELAEKLALSQQAVAKWETGETMPRADKLPALANLLHCTTDELLEEISAPK